MKEFLYNFYFASFYVPLIISLKDIFYFLLSESVVLKLTLVVLLSFFLSLLLSTMLLNTAWFFSALKNLSRNLWIYFLLAFPFYLVSSVQGFFEIASWSFWHFLFGLVSSLVFIFLIGVFYVRRGSDELYEWLIFNTRIRVFLVNFILLSLIFFCQFFEDISQLTVQLSSSLVANLDALSFVLESTMLLDFLKALVLIWSYFLYCFVRLMVLVFTTPFLILLSNFLVSGVLLRGIYLHPFLLELFNGLTVLENNVSTDKLVVKGFNLNLTVPELFGKTVVSTEKYPLKGFARSFSSLSKQGILETRISWSHYPQNVSKSYSVLANENLSEITSFLKSQKSFSHWKNFLPFSAIEKKILSLAVSETSLQHKLLVMYVVFESHLTGKASEEVFSSICHKLGFFSGTEEEIRAKLTAYGLNSSTLSTLGVHSLNLVDLVNVRELYNCINHLNNSYSPQHLTLTGNYLAEYCRSSFFRSLGLLDDVPRNFSNPKDGNLQQQVQLVTEILFQFLRYFPAEHQHLDPSQQPWGSSESQKAILRSGRHIRQHLPLVESKDVYAFLEAVEKIRFGDYKVHLSTGEQFYVDVTQISNNASVRIVANPQEVSTEDVSIVVRSNWRVAIEKCLNNDPQVEISINQPLFFVDGKEFSALLGKTSKHFVFEKNLLISQKERIVYILDRELQNEKAEAIFKQKVGRRYRFSKDIAVLQGLTFQEVLSKTSHTTAVTIKK